MINRLVRGAPAAFWNSLGPPVCGSGLMAEDTDTELGSPTATGTRAIRSREDTVVTNTSVGGRPRGSEGGHELKQRHLITAHISAGMAQNLHGSWGLLAASHVVGGAKELPEAPPSWPSTSQRPYLLIPSH